MTSKTPNSEKSETDMLYDELNRRKGPVFQHRHYKAIAAKLAWIDHDGMWEIIRDALADTFEADNPRFDRQRFLDACAGEPSNGKDKVS